MASGSDGPSGLNDTSSLEIALDIAIARRFAGVQERGSGKRRNTPASQLPAVRAEMAHTPTEKLGGRSTALAVTSKESSLIRPPARLRWKGIEVTDEFQAYAARVERGEELAPYRGPVLSRPCAEFPWTIAPREQQMLPPSHASLSPERMSLPPEHPSLAPQRPSLAPMSVSLPTSPLSEPTVYPERGRALKTALWLAGAVSSIVAALGVGAGATSTTDNDFEGVVPAPRPLAQRPAPAAGEEPSASNLDPSSPPDTSIGERQLDSLAVDDQAAAVVAPALPPAPAAPARAVAARPSAAVIPVAGARAPAAPAASPEPGAASLPAASATSSPSSSRLSIPPPGPAPIEGEFGRGIVTSARPTEHDEAMSSSDSGASLFSDRAPF